MTTTKNKPRLKTKADLAQYAADLEVDLAYAEREIQKLKNELDQAWQLIEDYTEPQETVIFLDNEYAFSMPHPGYVC